MINSNRWLRYSVSALLFIIATFSCSILHARILNTDIAGSGKITDRNLGEISGIAVSGINKDILWVINDSGNSASVYGLNPDGKLMCTLNIRGVSNNDWEDIASFEYKGKYYILIADTGDNFAKRSKCFLHIVEEPDLGKTGDASSLSVTPSWSITYTYEDGPRDCESVAVDTVSEKILLLSKRDAPPVLYELPLKKDKKTVAKRLTEIKPLPERSDDILDFRSISSQPTGMDIKADGSAAVVITYGNAFYYRKKPSKDWAEVFTSAPEEIIVPRMRQAESICFSRDGAGIYITSEQIPAPLYRLNISGSGK